MALCLGRCYPCSAGSTDARRLARSWSPPIASPTRRGWGSMRPAWRLLSEILLSVAALPLYAISVIAPRRKDVWVFGAWFGREYSDNSRYMFEYVAEHEPRIRAVWLTRERTICRRIRETVREAHLAWSWTGFWAVCRAGAAFVTCGNRDLIAAAIGRARRIQLWHGTPLKKIKADDVVSEHRPRNWLGALARRLGLFVLRHKQERWDLIVSPSPAVTPRLSSAFQVGGDVVRVLGYPRADVILQTPAVPIPTLRISR